LYGWQERTGKGNKCRVLSQNQSGSKELGFLGEGDEEETEIDIIEDWRSLCL
jgi:hypothetical protein